MRTTDQETAPLGDASGLHTAIVVARFNPEVTGRLREGAVRALIDAGASESRIEVFDVPGAFELPQAARAVAETGRFDAVICLGCVIRGETPHFEYISSAVSHGLTEAAAATGIPMAFGVLTTNSVEEALARAVDGSGNKGREAAVAAIEMAEVIAQLTRQPAPKG